MNDKNTINPSEILATVVVGAGPAGLLFSLINRIGMDKRGITLTKWPLLLLEKRTTYVRNHRLQLDKSEFIKVQKQLNSVHFDKFIQFLENVRYRPVINDLEVYLTKVLSDFGVHHTICDVGINAGQSSLEILRTMLPEAFSKHEKFWTIVAADSVRGTVSKMLGNDRERVTGAHEYLIRLKLIGKKLPKSLHITENFKLSKVLSSILFYRFNKNGFAEMDLFLNPLEHSAISHLKASPKNPIVITQELLDQLYAPFFKQILLAITESDFGVSLHQIQIQSSFTLEHSINPSRVRCIKELNAYGFLLGDAAISLPFQRGMAAMIQCAYQLSEVHFSLFNLLLENKSASDPWKEFTRVASRYQYQTELTVKKELKIVSSRASLVFGLRQFIRISAMLPFPIQSWILGYEKNFSKKPLNRSQFFINLILASSASISLVMAFFLPGDSLLFILSGFLIQFIGGFMYRATITFLNQVHMFIKRIWQVQIICFMLFGIGVIIFPVHEISRFSNILLATSWWIGGVFFAMGLVVFDQLGDHWVQKGRL